MAKRKKTGYYNNWNALNEMMEKLDYKYDAVKVRYYYHRVSTGLKSNISRNFNPIYNSGHSDKLLSIFLNSEHGKNKKIFIHCENDNYRLVLVTEDGSEVHLSVENKLKHAIFWGIANAVGLNKESYFTPYT